MMLQDIKFAVHAHPTLSEVVDELFKAAKVNKYKNLDFTLFSGCYINRNLDFKVTNSCFYLKFQVESSASTTAESVKVAV